MARIQVKTPHFSAGVGPSSAFRLARDAIGASPSSDETETTSAARGPNTAAANTVGRTEIDTSVVLSSRTRPLSATAATTASPTTAAGFPSPYGIAKYRSTPATTASAA